MKCFAVGIAVSAAFVALTACAGGTPGEGVVGSTPEGEVEAVFRGYYDAILARDFEAACSFNAPETNDSIVSSMKLMAKSASSCPEALEMSVENATTAETLDTVARTAEVQEVTVTGDTAELTWSAEMTGQRAETTTPLRRIDGEWRLLYVGP